jgi:uncharacterized DUF497 family protein
MQITNLEWSEDNILHIARHRVEPEEVEEVCFSHSSCIENGRQGFYYVSGQTTSGRYLFVVIRFLSHGKAIPITARDMDEKEKDRYKKWR